MTRYTGLSGRSYVVWLISTWLIVADGCPATRPGCSCLYQPGANSSSSEILQYITCDDLGQLDQVPVFEISYDETELLTIAGNTTVRQLQSQAFANLKARRLSLRNLLITSVDHLAFSGLETTLVALNVGGNDVVSWPYDTFFRLTEMTSLILDRNKVSSFDQSAFRGLTRLRALDVSNNVIGQLPYTIFQDLVELRTLRLCCNSLTSFQSDQLSNAVNLEQLDVSSNELTTSVDQMSFQTLLALKFIDLSDNLITGNLGSTVVSGLQNLVTFNLSTNRIVSVSADAFRGCSSLRILDLSNNNITVLPGGTFDDLLFLEVLNVSSNAIVSVSGNLFPSVNSLQQVDFSNNDMIDLPFALFTSNNSHLLRVDLTSNYIETIADGTLTVDSSVRVLQLADNSLTTFGRSFLTSLPLLIQLNASNNRFQTFAVDTFRQQFNLVELDLNDNVLVNLPVGLFQHCSKLTVLLLSGNRLLSISDGVLQGPSGLRVLDLSDNLLTTFQSESIRYVNLATLTIAGNSLICDCRLEWLRHYTALVDSETTVCCSSNVSCIYFACRVSRDNNNNCSRDYLFPLCSATTAVTSARNTSLPFVVTSAYAASSRRSPVTSSARLSTLTESLRTTFDSRTSGGPSTPVSSSSLQPPSTVRTSTTTPSTPVSDSSGLNRDSLIAVCVIVSAVSTSLLVSAVFCVACRLTARCRQSSSPTVNGDGNGKLGARVHCQRQASGQQFRSPFTGGYGPERYVKTTDGSSNSLSDVTGRVELSRQEDINSPL